MKCKNEFETVILRYKNYIVLPQKPPFEFGRLLTQVYVPSVDTTGLFQEVIYFRNSFIFSRTGDKQQISTITVRLLSFRGHVAYLCIQYDGM